MSTLFKFCLIFSWFFILFSYKLTGANDGLTSFKAFELVNIQYKKSPWKFDKQRVFVYNYIVGMGWRFYRTHYHTQRHTPHTARRRFKFYSLCIATMDETTTRQQRPDNKRDDLIKRIADNYDAMYNADDIERALERAGYLEKGEDFIGENPYFMDELVERRGDFFSSDREIMALYAGVYGMGDGLIF